MVVVVDVVVAATEVAGALSELPTAMTAIRNATRPRR
jgi:hypothetical protein